jgi:hypothetical protein
MRILIVLVAAWFTLMSEARLPAQNHDWFAPMGATWTYYDWSGIPPYMYTDGRRPYFQIKVDKDSTINGLPARRIVRVSHKGEVEEASAIWIHTDAARMYTLHIDTFLLYFDRSVQAGDTMHFYLPLHANLYDNACCQTIDSTHRISGVVDTIFTAVPFGTESFTKWLVKLLPDHQSFLDPYFYFTEAIGNEHTLFLQPTACCLGGFGGHLHCYEDHQYAINIDTVACTYIVQGIGTETERHPVSISPNPTTGAITLSLAQDIQIPETLAVLYDLQGRAVRQYRITTWPASLHLDVVPGLYFLHLPTRQGGRGFPVVVE